MCGITGLYAFNEIGRFALINLHNATQALAQRGPDFEDTYLDYFVGLGHRRLSVIDTSAQGNQPLIDPTGNFVIVFNGEIYNYKALRQELESEGISFRSESDTEVLLQLYIKYKEHCLQKLQGFFAFAIYDKQDNSLFMARDRMGIKPLLYTLDEDKLVFASEMKALFHYGIDKSLDFISLQQYLELNYIPAPHSIFKSVKKLLPGHYLIIKGSRLEIQPYFKINDQVHKVISYDQAQSQLRTLLEAAVEKRLVSDVPLGAFLSGGIDSSVIVALTAGRISKLATFSIGYRDEPFFDETKYAQAVAKQYKTDHTVFSLSYNDLYDHLFNVLNYIDEPFADSSALPVYILSKLTRKKVKVALSGDGADELFAGYNKHRAEYALRQRDGKGQLIYALRFLWKNLPKSRNSGFSNKIRQLYRFAEAYNLSAQDRYWQWASLSKHEEVKGLFHKNIEEQLEESTYQTRKTDILKYLTSALAEKFNEVLYTDMHLVLPNDMLHKVDSMSMANGLEVRVPFLDHDLINFVFSLPASYKIQGNFRKKILQDTFKKQLPAMLYKRPKQGFEVPLLNWMRTELRPLIENELLNEEFIRAQGIFNTSSIEILKQKLFSKNPEDSHARLWGLLVFQYWWKKHIKN